MTKPIDLSKYDEDFVKTTDAWVAYCLGLIDVDPDNCAHLRKGLKLLATQAEKQYPELESGKVVMLEPDMLGDDWPLGEQAGSLFVTLTGTIFFNSQDGPRPTFLTLDRVLELLYERRTGGEACARQDPDPSG